MRAPILIGAVALVLGIGTAALLLVRTTDPGSSPVPAVAAEDVEASPATPGFASSPAVVERGEETLADVAARGASAQPGGTGSESGTVNNNQESEPETISPATKTRIAELEELGTMDDPASLRTILAELGNADAQIRKAALDAAVQFGSRDAIPGLTEAAARTADAAEKQAILDAIEFLKLPSLTEFLQRGRVARPASLQPGANPPGRVPKS